MAESTRSLKGERMPLPPKVQKLGADSLVETKSLVAGDKFVFGGKVWTVLAVKPDGMECREDPTFFKFESLCQR
jgi:hypothetical protein